MQENIKHLDYSLIEEAGERYNEVFEVPITLAVNGEIHVRNVGIYKYFSPTKINTYVQELINGLDIARTYNKKSVSDIAIPYSIFLIIKNFTTLKLPSFFAEQLKAIENMINTGAMFQIFAEFDPNEIDKLMNEVVRVVENFDVKLPDIEKIKEQIAEQLQDKSLLE